MLVRTPLLWQAIILSITALFSHPSPSSADTTTQVVAQKHRVDIALVLAVDVSS